MPDDPVIELMTEASTVVGSVGGGAVAERRRHELDVLGVFDRCRSLLGAIRLLLANKFTHEAVMLGRPLFADSLFLMEYAAVDERRRTDMVVGWTMASLSDLEGIVRSKADDAALRTIAAQRTALEGYARRHGARTRFWRPDDHVKPLSKKHGRTEEYTGLLVAQHFVHGSTLAVSQRYAQVSEDSIEVGGPAVEHDAWARDAGLFAAESTLLAARAACAIFGWEEPPEIERLLRRIEEMVEAQT